MAPGDASTEVKHVDFEIDARAGFLQEFPDAARLSSDTLVYLSFILASRPPALLADVSNADYVGRLLVVRLANDLTAATELLVTGYPTQAATLVASMVEVAFTVAYIRDNEERARKWLTHGNPRASFKELTKLVDVVLTELPGLENRERRKEFFLTVYRHLCAAKHANPMHQRARGHYERLKTYCEQRNKQCHHT